LSGRIENASESDFCAGTSAGESNTLKLIVLTRWLEKTLIISMETDQQHAGKGTMDDYLLVAIGIVSASSIHFSHTLCVATLLEYDPVVSEK
jgi:hypothetical protein